MIQPWLKMQYNAITRQLVPEELSAVLPLKESTKKTPLIRHVQAKYQSQMETLLRSTHKVDNIRHCSLLTHELN